MLIWAQLICNLQLNIKEAFELCRYEWMREALEAFLRVMETDEMTKPDLTTEDEKKIAGMPMPDEVVEESQEINISSSNISSNSCTSTSHHPAVVNHITTSFTSWHSKCNIYIASQEGGC